MTIYCAIPASGKTTLVSKYPDKYADSDDLLTDLKVDDFELAIRNDVVRDKIVTAIQRVVDNGLILLANFDPARLGFKVDRYFTYRPEDYVNRVRKVKRTDLIDVFGEDELTRWVQPHPSRRPVTVMEPDESLEDYLETK